MSAFRPLAVVCLADDRLRGVCSLLLRHAGYSIVEAGTVEEAKSAVESKKVSMLIAGVISDPEDQLSPLAAARSVACVRLGPGVQIEALLKLFEEIQP